MNTCILRLRLSKRILSKHNYNLKACVSAIRNHFHSSSDTKTSHTLCQLKSRAILQLSGADSFTFLQGLVTNDVNQLAEKTPSTQYCMMLNVQGRVLYDLFLYNVSSQDKTKVFVDVDSTGKDDLLKLFKRYKLRKKVDVSDVSDQYKLWCQLSPSFSKDGDRSPMTFHDPRVPLFGCRFISNQNLGASTGSTVVGEEDYTALRYSWGIPEGVHDLPPGNCLPLESNLAIMNGVNFQKGCYIGQELTARTFHTGVIRKRIVPLHLECPADIPPDATLTTKLKGRNAGKFRKAVGENGLGVLRLAYLNEDLVVTATDGREVSVKAGVPDWWPSGLIS